MSQETTRRVERTGDSRGVLASLSGRRLDAVVATLSALMVTGVALDFRRHSEGISFAEEGFFTPEHVFFYSMFVGIAAVIGAATVLNRRDGAAWVEAVPDGYGWGVLGVLLFGAGGVADFGWHSTFGFEQGVEGLTSPSHLLLATGAVLFLASPLRAAGRREDAGGVALVPALLSTSFALTVFALFTAYVNPLVNLFATADTGTARHLGVPAFLVFPALLVGTGLALARGFDLPPGALAATFAVPALASTALNGYFEFVVPAVLAGLAGDAVVRWRRPTPAHPTSLRAFGVAVPVTFGAAYFLTVAATRGIAWTVHVWTGAVVLAGMAGLLLTYVVVPDAAARGEER